MPPKAYKMQRKKGKKKMMRSHIFPKSGVEVKEILTPVAKNVSSNVLIAGAGTGVQAVIAAVEVQESDGEPMGVSRSESNIMSPGNVNKNKQSPRKLCKEDSGVPGSESEGGDGEFEPTADMLVNDFDDERTLDEEEQMEQGSDPDDEIDNLQKEQDMPIEELLAMYGGKTTDPDAAVAAEAEKNGQTTAAADVDGADEQGGAEDITAVASGGDDVEMLEEPEVISSRSSTSEETTNNNEKESKPDAKPERKAKQKKISELAQLYTDMDTNGNDATTGASSRSLRSTAGSRQQSEDEDEEEGECSGEEEDWHKTIMIGSSYQAQVPEGLSAYGATPPYENQDTLLWEPGKLRAKQTEDYLRALNHPPPGTQGVAALPLGRHVRDDEQALYLLLQCGYNVEEALRRHRMNPSPLASTMTLWSEEECRNFENGLKTYGKDFHLIQQNKVRTRSVGELVQFYYLWKKTERHDLFAAKSRIEKKKYIVHPGTTDYMDRFLDEGQHQHHQAQADAVLLYRGENTRAPSPAINSLLYGRRSPGTAAVGVAAPISIPSVAASAAIASAVPAATGEPTAHPLLLAADTSTDASVSGGLNQLEDLARHLDSDHLNHLAASLASAGAPMEIDTAAAVMAARAAAAVVATSGRQLITGPSTATAPSVPASPITTATPPTSLAH